MIKERERENVCYLISFTWPIDVEEGQNKERRSYAMSKQIQGGDVLSFSLSSPFPFLCTCVSGEAISLLVNLSLSFNFSSSLYLSYLSDHTIVHLFALLMIFALLTSISLSLSVRTFRSSCSLDERTHSLGFEQSGCTILRRRWNTLTN